MATVVAEVRFQQLGVHAHTSVVLAGEDSLKRLSLAVLSCEHVPQQEVLER